MTITGIYNNREVYVCVCGGGGVEGTGDCVCLGWREWG